MAASLSVVACSGTESAEEDAALDTGGQFGLMSVAYDYDSDDRHAAPDGEPQGGLRDTTDPGWALTTLAQFVRYTAMNADQVARLLGLPLDPDHDLPATETCRVFDLTRRDDTTLGLSEDETGDERTAGERERGHVELLEAGALRVETSEATVTLQPRHFPGLLPFISGVVYHEAESAVRQQPGTVTIASKGGDAVGAFAATASSPAVPRLLSDVSSELRAGRGGALTVRWQVTAPADGETLYIELKYRHQDHDLALRCSPRDDGAFVISSELLARVPAGTATLEIARLRRTFFTAQGIDRGELRVTVRQRAGIEIH